MQCKSTGEFSGACVPLWAQTRDNGILRCHLSFRCDCLAKCYVTGNRILLLVTRIGRSIRDVGKFSNSQYHLPELKQT